MSFNGKRDGFERADLVAFCRTVGFKAAQAEALIDRVAASVAKWPDFAAEAGVDDRTVARIRTVLRLESMALRSA